MKARFAIALVCLTLGSAVAAFGTTRGTGVELPKGAAIEVVVESLREDATKAGLNENSVQARVELQLRRNGINVQKDSDGPYYIYVNINIVGKAFSIDVTFLRDVTYEVNGQEFRMLAKTYDKGTTGTHGSNSEYIMQSVLEKIDILSNEILKSAQ